MGVKRWRTRALDRIEWTSNVRGNEGPTDRTVVVKNSVELYNWFVG